MNVSANGGQSLCVVFNSCYCSCICLWKYLPTESWQSRVFNHCKLFSEQSSKLSTMWLRSGPEQGRSDSRVNQEWEKCDQKIQQEKYQKWPFQLPVCYNDAFWLKSEFPSYDTLFSAEIKSNFKIWKSEHPHQPQPQLNNVRWQQWTVNASAEHWPNKSCISLLFHLYH